MSQADQVATVEAVIAARKTTKVLGDPDNPTVLSPQASSDIAEALPHMLEAASWAPFHYPSSCADKSLTSVVPWRAYTFDKEACNKAISIIREKAAASDDTPCIWKKSWDSKIPKLLAGCATMVLFTWIADHEEDSASPAFSPRNVEHVAGASCAVQNFMLSAEARGYLHYWSTGGIFREAPMLELLGIDASQHTLGTIFVAPADQENVSYKGGALRDRRGPIEGWAKAIKL